MIRRAATWNHGTVEAPATVTGWVLGWYITGTPATGQQMIMSFESGADGSVVDVADSLITFTDGQPTTIPVIE